MKYLVDLSKETKTMSIIIKSKVVGIYTVQVRSTRECARVKAEYFIEVYCLREHFGMEVYQAQVGYHPNTLKTKSSAYNVAESIASGKTAYKGFMGGESNSIPQSKRYELQD